MTRNTYFQSIEAFKDKQVIKVLTGIRWCGKSALLEDKMNYVFIDEVQLCKDFQKPERKTLCTKIKIVIPFCT